VVRARVFEFFADGVKNRNIQMKLNTNSEAGVTTMSEFDAVFRNRRLTLTKADLKTMRNQWTRSNQIHPNDVITLHIIEQVCKSSLELELELVLVLVLVLALALPSS
jgi:hypothetical protein